MTVRVLCAVGTLGFKRFHQALVLFFGCSRYTQRLNLSSCLHFSIPVAISSMRLFCSPPPCFYFRAYVHAFICCFIFDHKHSLQQLALCVQRRYLWRPIRSLETKIGYFQILLSLRESLSQVDFPGAFPPSTILVYARSCIISSFD